MANNYTKMFRDDLARLWNGLDLPKKFALVAMVAITLIAASYFLFKMTEPSWTTLYSGLSDTDTSAITESLKKGGYPYKISKDKKAIMVPVEIQDELRLYVAENDLIKDSGTPGFELLDDLQLGSTDFKNQLTKQRIFQGELTRSIEKINGIQKARVQIAEPERSIFEDKDEAPTASVVLILAPGHSLKNSQVKVIKSLVAYSIPRLTPEKVFITDQNGNILSDDSEKNSSDIESYKTNFESQTAKKVQSVLDKIVGKENATVQVSADLDFNTTKATIESYVPVTPELSQGVLTSEQTETEFYDNPNAVPNVTSGELASNKNINYQKQKTSSTYSVSKEIKQVLYAPGSVKRLTVAVAVNKILTEDEKTELKNLIISAAGLDLERGDLINITSLQFAGIQEEKQATQAAMEQYNQEARNDIIFNKVLPLVVVLILGGGALFVVASFLKKIGENMPVAVASEDNFYPTLDEPFQLTESDFQNEVLTDASHDMEVKINPEFDKMRNDLTDSILSDPQEATKILMSYIKD